MNFLNQPFNGQVGENLINLLNSPDYQIFTFIVAFAKNSGVLRIKDSLENFRKNGGKIIAYVGIDLGGTSYEALKNLFLHTDSLNVVHFESVQTFHPKIYYFSGEEKGTLIVGSNNLTGGGLWTNCESSIILSFDQTTEEGKIIDKEMKTIIANLNSLKQSCVKLNSPLDIENLLQNGYVLKEIMEYVHRTDFLKTSNKRKIRIFGNSISVKIPQIKNVSTKGKPKIPDLYKSINKDQDGLTIWFETRSMTGGSRNILDLSMRSVLEEGDITGTFFDLSNSKYIKGTVEYFGIDPSKTDTKKNITLNFEGVDYSNNTILFPMGKNANGTWRLQIKGESPNKVRITEAFKKKSENYLVNKIITFTRIKDDYYFISVFPNSMIEEFKKASSILARNGQSRKAKQFGVL